MSYLTIEHQHYPLLLVTASTVSTCLGELVLTDNIDFIEMHVQCRKKNYKIILLNNSITEP